MKKPTGFFATCRCGVIVAVCSYRHSDRLDVDRIVNRWWSERLSMTAHYNESWSVQVGMCRCEAEETS